MTGTSVELLDAIVANSAAAVKSYLENGGDANARFGYPMISRYLNKYALITTKAIKI